jgi:hypothetical protein
MKKTFEGTSLLCDCHSVSTTNLCTGVDRPWGGARLDEALETGTSLFSLMFGVLGIFLGLGVFIVFVLRSNK